MAVVLPAPLWPSSPSTDPGGDGQIDIAQCPQVAVAFAETAGPHGDPVARVPARRCRSARVVLGSRISYR